MRSVLQRQGARVTEWILKQVQDDGGKGSLPFARVPVARPAGGDAFAPGGALALIALLVAAVGLADIGIGAVAAVDHCLGAAVELDRAEPVGAVFGILHLGEGRGGGEERKREDGAEHIAR